MMDYKEFFHTAERVLKKEDFDRVLRFMEMKRMKDRLEYPELYEELDCLKDSE